ncbi:MAG: ROK family protein [Candidatus Puniceispirillaceae bacterium]|jgi:fructokinase
MSVGIHIATDFISTATLSSGGDFVFYEQIETPAHDAGTLCRHIAELVQRSAADPTTPVSVAINAGFGGQPSPPNSAPVLANLDVKSALQASLGRPVDCIAPAQAYALYEASFGAAQTSGVACLLYLDQNVTGGVTFGQTLWKGGNRLAGAWGHMPLGWPVPHELDGRDCWCGRTGCLESFISAKGVEADYLASTETALTVDEIAKAASQNDIVAESVLQVLDDRVGRATAMLINMLDPDIITLAGRLASLDRLYINVPRKWPGYTFTGKSATHLVRAARGDDAILAGACIHAKMAR